MASQGKITFEILMKTLNKSPQTSPDAADAATPIVPADRPSSVSKETTSSRGNDVYLATAACCGVQTEKHMNDTRPHRYDASSSSSAKSYDSRRTRLQSFIALSSLPHSHLNL